MNLALSVMKKMNLYLMKFWTQNLKCFRKSFGLTCLIFLIMNNSIATVVNIRKKTLVFSASLATITYA